MSREQLQGVITRELEKLNDRIDRKIVKGRTYASEARRHKELLRQLHTLRAAKRYPAQNTFGAHKATAPSRSLFSVFSFFL